MYYPKSHIKTDLYTNGNEFVLKSNNQNYIGWYWSTFNGLFYTGKSPDAPYYEEIIKVVTNENNIPEGKYSTVYYDLTTIEYLQLKEISEMQKKLPSYYHPSPKEEDYNNGYFYRFFCKKANENIFIEINEKTYNSLINQDSEFDFSMFMPFRVKWILKGENKTVEEENIKIISELERNNKFFGFLNYFKNFTQFWQS